MASSTRSTGSGHRAWLLALVGTGLAVSTGCEPGRVNAPLSTVAGPTAKPSHDIVESDGLSIPCFANSRACGEFRAVVNTPVEIDEAYVTIFEGKNGAWIKTWSPTHESGYMSAVGTAHMVQGSGRNYRQRDYPLAGSQYGTSTGDGFSAQSTCSYEYNSVFGSSRHSAQGGTGSNLGWYGTFN